MQRALGRGSCTGGFERLLLHRCAAECGSFGFALRLDPRCCFLRRLTVGCGAREGGSFGMLLGFEPRLRELACLDFRLDALIGLRFGCKLGRFACLSGLHLATVRFSAGLRGELRCAIGFDALRRLLRERCFCAFTRGCGFVRLLLGHLACACSCFGV